jgi:hypothetical protein
MMHAQEAAMQDQRRQMILERQRIDDDIYAQRLLGKLDDNDDHVQVRLHVLSCIIQSVSFLAGSIILIELRPLYF